jgi:enamine deaminase RidA (YjgF/YER057c/UK114 family)
VFIEIDPIIFACRQPARGCLFKIVNNYGRMNVVYKARNWGAIPPTRAVIFPAGIPYNSLFEIDCIAYI